MPKISLIEVAEAYNLSCAIASGVMSERDAIKTLQSKFGMNASSAAGYLRKRSQLLQGIPYTRTVNLNATRYFLERIEAEEGPGSLSKAIQSVRAHATYYQKARGIATPGLDNLTLEFERHLTDQFLGANWDEEVSASSKLTPQQRKSKLPPAGHIPDQVTVKVTRHLRNPHVVAEVLYRAKGYCQSCKSPAPFLKKSGEPYLEVHHRKRLSEKGEDTVANAVALCPNCHRREHYG